MSLTERAYTQALQALKEHLDDYELPPGTEPGWDGNIDPYIAGVLRLAATGQITNAQAEKILGPELGWTMLCRFQDLAQAFYYSSGPNGRKIWEEYRDISEWIASH